MTKDKYSTMLQFTAAGLANTFFEQYQFEYGEKKIIEIVQKIENSEKINFYLAGLLRENLRPSAKGLEILMNTISYFMFSKEETLCLGGLCCFMLWRGKTNLGFDIEEDENPELTRICADLIVGCSKNKYNKSSNFFNRFFIKIDEIGRQTD